MDFGILYTAKCTEEENIQRVRADRYRPVCGRRIRPFIRSASRLSTKLGGGEWTRTRTST